MLDITFTGFSLLTIIVVTFLTGALIVFTSKPPGPDYAACGRCLYDVAGSIGRSEHCPECGASLVEAGVVTRKSQRRNVAALILGGLLCTGAIIGGVAFASSRVTTVALKAPGTRVLPTVEYRRDMTIRVPVDAPTGTINVRSLTRKEMLELLAQTSKLLKTTTDEATKTRLRQTFDALLQGVRGGS